MSNVLKSVLEYEGTQVRTIIKGDEVWFVLKDVCQVLGLKSHHVKERLTDDIVSNDTVIDTIGRTNKMITVNEDGLYDVILESRKPEAKAFRKWVTRDVLPSIRNHGGYIASDATKEQVKILTDYHPTNLYDTFANAIVSTDNLNKMITDCMKFYKSAPYDKPVKKNSLYKKQMFKSIRKALNKLRADNGNKSNFGEVLTLDAVIINLAEREQKTIRNSSKSKITYRDKKIVNLATSQVELKEIIDKLSPPDISEYFVIDKHPFSENYIVDAGIDSNGNAKIIKHNIYKKWEKEFPIWQMPAKEDIDIDWSLPIISYLRYVNQDKFDMSNFDKSFHDFVFKYYAEDDIMIKHNNHATIDNCVNKSDGKIYWLLKNIEVNE